MKRFVSIVLAIMMIASMFTTVSAATIEEHTHGYSYITNPLDMTLGVSVLARKSGEGDYSDRAISLDTVGDGMGIDYKATLDMSTIRGFFDKPFITTVLGGDDQAIAEFNAGTVSSTINVAITYPADAVIADGSDLATAGTLDAGSIFSEVSRSGLETAASGATKTLTITYKNADNLTAGELSANKDTYLKDIAFYLDNVVSYNEDGLHKVTVSLTGSTTITFASRTQTINYSGASSYIVSAAINHLLQVVPAVPATCDEMGWTEGVKCVSHDSYNCGANGTVEPQQTIPKLNHNTIFVAEVPATCTSTGVAAHYMCILCKKDFSDAGATDEMDKSALTLNKLPHDYETIAEITPTCTEKGMTAGGVCRVCGHTQTRTSIPANGHTVVTDAAVAATCTTAGKTEGSHCSVCSTVLVTQKPVPALGHNWGEWTITVQPTEQATGSKTRVCLNDSNHTETVEIPKLEHTCVISAEDAVITKAATCTDAGEMQNYCACGLPVGDPVEIPATGHSANDGYTAGVVATCTSTGILEHWSCETCGGLFTDAARTQKVTSVVTDKDLNNHGNNKVKMRAIAPTCELNGLTEGEKCVACSTVTVKQETVPATGHTLEEIDEEPATCTHTGTLAHKHCTVCDKDFSHDLITEITVEQYTTPALGHSYNYVGQVVKTEPTEDAEGLAWVYCGNECGHYKEVRIAKLQHTHNEECEKIVRTATCTVDGLKRIVYTCCNTIKEDNIRIPAAHNPIKVNAVAATCFKTGTREHWYCPVCEKSFEDAACTREIINLESLKTDVLSHTFVFHHENDNFTFNKCSLCNEMVKIQKNDKAEVKNHGGIKEDKDKTKEDRHNEEKEETGRKVTVNANINIEDREISANLETEIHKNDTEENKASDNKVVLDIVIEKVTTYTQYTDDGNDENDDSVVLDEDREFVSETNDLIEIDIIIPESMRGFVDFLVHRMHNGVAEEIKTAPNADGEYIVIAPDKSKVTLYVKKFSEYALVGYETVVNPDPKLPLPSPVTGGSTSSTLTVKFNANGGTIVKDVTVKRGEKITAPETTRDGYRFVGWYTDLALTKLFDFDTAVTGNITLYAKWSDGTAGCPGTAEGGCPAVRFADVDTSAWYHLDVDYVIDNALMNGVAEDAFAPNSPLTRAMLVTVLYRAEGAPEIADASQFADVAIDTYYEKAVVWAEKNGIVKGYSDTAFGPDDNILREQIAAIMHRYAQYKGYDVSVGENTNILSYTDVADVSEYAISAMQYAVGSGLMNGRTESTLNPKDNTTRAEIAAILHRFFEAHK